MEKTRTFVFLSLFIAMQIILTRFLSIQTPIIRIGFSFLPLALSAVLFGPVYAGIAAAIADVIGMMLFPQGTYFPGFTFSALLSGILYGIVLYKKPVTIIRAAFAVLLVSLFVDLGFNTLWLSIITGKAAAALFIPRAVKTIIMFPIQIICIELIYKYTRSFFRLPLVNKNI